MAYENGKLAVVDNSAKVTFVYTLSGALVERIVHPEAVKKELVSEVAEIGESYVVWETFQGNYY